MRKALCVGIDSYLNIEDQHGCVTDASSVKSVLERNGDGTLNFDVRIMCATSETSYITRGNLKEAIQELFNSDVEIAVLYYAGHGSYDSCGGYLCTSEIKNVDEGLALSDVMTIVEQSKVRNKILIFDSCHSGGVAQLAFNREVSILPQGTVILAACANNQYASEENNHGVFTALLVEALYGGAMNLLGEVSPGSIYAYIDRALGCWEQRPIFKANISRFVSLRKNTPPITITELRKIVTIFESPYDDFQLDPTYEPDKHATREKDINTEHESIFATLQKYTRLNLVIPINAEHMYYAAINSKSCRLTALGQHYWYLVNKGTI